MNRAKDTRSSSPSTSPTNPAASLNPGESVLLPPIELLCQQINRITERITKNWRTGIEESWKLPVIVGALQQLVSFATPPGSALPQKELKAGTIKLILWKVIPVKEAMAAFYRSGEARRGRQPKRRHVAAAALEAKYSNPQLTRLKLTKLFCPCGKTHHDHKCVERLRRDMLRLKRLIESIEKAFGQWPA